MLENLAAQVLNRYIGQYVENINTQNLSIGLLRGAVELENLPLKKDALDGFDLPGIVLKSGHIGKVILRIKSYKSIKEPWIVEIHRLQLVVGPGEVTRTVDKELEKKKKEEQKQRDLETLEEKWRAKHGQNTSLYSVWYSYSSSIITTIMENLQFEMHDVQIRYEDDVTLSQKFSCGICIKNLTSKSTDEKWVPTSGERTTSEMMFKLLQLDGFSVYWDTDSEMVGHLSPDKLDMKLRKWEKTEPQLVNNGDEDNQDQKTSSLLFPVSGQAKLTKHSSSLPLTSRSKPRISLEVMLGEISLHLSHTQYKQAIALSSEISRSEKRNVYKDGRPGGRLKEDARNWWKWAIDTHRQQIRKIKERCSKTFLLNRARTNIDYVRMYTKIILSKMELDKLLPTETTLLESKLSILDKDLSLHEIQILREVVFERVEKVVKKKQDKAKKAATLKKTENEPEKAKGWGSWLRGWGRSWSAEKPKAEANIEEESDEVVLESGAGVDGSVMNDYDSVYKDLNEDDLYEMFGEELAEQDTNDTFMKRDSVLLKLNFSLDAGTLTLHEDNNSLSSTLPFIDLEFRDLSATTEWRPRYKSNELRVDLGGLYVKDLSNNSRCFSELIKPQVLNIDSSPHSPRENDNIMPSSIKGIFDLLSPVNVEESQSQIKTPVFSLLYRNQPKTSTNKFANRLEIVSAPIVITFLPNLVERVKGFFKVTDAVDDVLELDDGISATALEKYEIWKQQSQTEIKRTVKRMMDGKTTANVSQDRWAVTLNISAPEIILPENSKDPNSNIVIANLGHITFRNHYEDDILPKRGDKSAVDNKMQTADEELMMDEEEDDDDFMTPPDTPTNGELSFPGFAQSTAYTDEEVSDSPSQKRLNEKLFYERMYEQYQIHFTDLQVLVARSSENWEATRTQGKGPHHLVEKFSVDILLERRVVPTLDPKCPAVKLKGNLPNLTIHLSHNKVHSLFHCLDHFSKKAESKQSTASNGLSSKTNITDKSFTAFQHENSKKSELKRIDSSQDEKAQSKQLSCKFSVNEISILLEESPASIISVLEVRRIQAEFTKRPYDHCSMFSIHSLLLIDTKQEIGHDYELLLASHGNVKMDLGSGNIMDSGTTSPDNGATSSSLVQHEESDHVSASTTKRILSSVATSLKKPNIFNQSDEALPKRNLSDSEDSQYDFEEDLITLEWGTSTSQNTTHNDVNVKFNSLDLVLNWKTWIALLGFLHRLKPNSSTWRNIEDIIIDESLTEKDGPSDGKVNQTQSEESQTKTSNDASDQNEYTELCIEFHNLNLLLMRHIEADKVIGRKVATLSMHNAKVFAYFGDKNENAELTDFDTLVDAHGSVGGLALQDLTSAVRDDHGMQVLCLGDLSNEFLSDNVPDIGTSHTETSIGSLKSDMDSTKGKEAFSFIMQKGKRRIRKRKLEQFVNDKGLDSQEEVIFNLHLASVLYMHSPRLVAEILALVDEAGDVVNARMTTDTKQAYKEMAYSIMDRSIAVLGKSVQHLTGGLDDSVSDNMSTKGNPPSVFKLTVDMQSPIVALPKCQGSFELLVGNLGKITVKNGHALGRCQPNEESMDFLNIEISDMNISSRRQIEEERKARSSSELRSKSYIRKTSSGPSLTKLKEASFSKNTSFSEIQILHDTSIRLNVLKKNFETSQRKFLDQRIPKRGEDGILMSDQVYDGPISEKKMCVTLEMTQPLFVSLSKPAYEQVLKTLDHISYGGNIDVDDIEGVDESIFDENSTTNMSFSSRNTSLQGQSMRDSVTSQQSTPSHNREFQMFSVPDLEKLTPVVTQAQSETSTITTRKYTPLSADITIPMISLQLSEDLSDGEQGVVKVTLKGFSAMLEKENRSTTHLDLTLKSLDIEDLLKEENSLHRHIVSSCSFTKSNRTNRETNIDQAYLSTSCPAFTSTTSSGSEYMSNSLPSDPLLLNSTRVKDNIQGNRAGVFRPYDIGSFNFATGPYGVSSATHAHQSHRSHNTNDKDEKPWTPPSSPTARKAEVEDETLVRIQAFLVDGKSTAYDDVYDRTNRRIDIDFNSLDCKINLQTWVVLLDFFGIGTSPKKTYELDQQTEKEYNLDQRLVVSSFYENQPDDFINSEIDFKVRSFSLIFNKEEYEFVKANISKFGSHIKIRNGTLGVAGQLGSLAVSDLSSNGNKYRERFVFAGEKALDFDIKKFDEYDYELKREFDIKVKLRMSAICYVHSHRFHQELVAYLLHFQQLQEVLGRMRAASVGQEVSESSRRQARILLDIEADSPVLLIPESSHSDRLVVADLGNMTVRNSFKLDGTPGTLSQNEYIQRSKQENPDIYSAPLSPGSRRCLLDVLHADLEQMDLYTAVRSDNTVLENINHCAEDKSILIFSSFIVKRDKKPLLREKCKLSLQIERNLEKETMVRNVPDTSVCGQLSSVYCTVDLQQYWLVRGILDHNLGEPIPEFPQPTACLQPSDIQTVLSGSVYTGMSIDMHLLNVSVELLRQHKTFDHDEVSLARLDYVKSRLSYRSFSDQTKTINLSCEAFVASDTRWKGNEFTASQDFGSNRSVFTTVLGPTHLKKKRKDGSRVRDSELQFELQFREGPGFLCFTALLVDMRVYIISDWLTDIYRYIIVNPAQDWCDLLRTKSAELLRIHKQVVPGQEKEKESVESRNETIKLNVTNTDFVLVENSTRADSDAVILRVTAVLHHNPKINKICKNRENFDHRKIMDCTLQSLEVFSCQLDCENETALSIVDPVKVNIEIEEICQKDLTTDELNFDCMMLDRTKLAIHIYELNTRVSYNDLLLFHAIMKTFSNEESEDKSKKDEASNVFELESIFEPIEKDVVNIMQLGYDRRDVVKGLQMADGNTEQAVDWLLENCEVLPSNERIKTSDEEEKKMPFNMGKIFLAIDSICVCLIDDCADCDAPLAELAIRSLEAAQSLSYTDPEKLGQSPTNYAGKANFILCGDYYNRMLSLWEPFLEPVRFGLRWNYDTGPTLLSTGKWDVTVKTADKLDVTVTSTLMETLKKTKDSWTKSFNRTNTQSDNLIDLGSTSDHSFSRKRKEFVPYVLSNLTGEILKFSTHVSAIQRPSSPARHKGPGISSRLETDSWITVMPGDHHPFRFDRTEKQRHKRSDDIILHQIMTKIGELETIPPVTISKVGVYFRHVTEEIVKSSSVLRPPDPVRVVFSVTLEGNAQKVVTVRSALVVRSKVKIPVQVHLTHGVEAVVLPRLDPGGVQYIPLSLTGYGIKIRPVHSSKILYKPSTQTIYWNQIKSDVTSTSDIIACPCETYPTEQPFRFSACVMKKLYPLYEDVAERLLSEKGHQSKSDDTDGVTKYGYNPAHMPGHTIVILPPVVVSNLLPCDLHYYFKDTSVGGKLSPGQDATLHILRLSPGSINQPPLLLGCGLEGFKECRELTITHMKKNTQMRMAMVDHRDRTLILNVRVFWRLGCSVKISIMAGYWIVNKTGLPIIISQDGATTSCAGQYDEHEKARSLTPLLFSYSDRGLPYLCTMRLGKEASQDMVLDRESKYPHSRSSTPYCQSFSIDGGTCTRNLSMVNHDNTPSRIYYIGVSVRRGWGRYMHTHIVTLAPRFLLINLTKSRALSFAQLHATSFTNDAAGLNRHLSIIPGSSVVFHWPRADLDLLLCTRLTKEGNCRWSGGFIIDKIDAFHVHLRIFGGAKGNNSIFLRVEITLIDATYRVMFYDGDISSCPSPLRIDNISEAPLVIRQCDTDEGLQIDVGPSSSVPYACDEPCLPPYIDCRVQGGAGFTQLNMDNIDEEKVLHYENFIYIVLGLRSSTSFSPDHHVQNQRVLTVQQVQYDQSVDGTGHLVTLQKRRSGNRSQLWRMTTEGYLRHEGSSPPSTGSKYPSSSNHQGLVLDIAELAMSRGNIMPLTVRNIDTKRKSQIWKFTNDGRLCTSFKNLCVQISASGEVGLAPYIVGGLATPNESCRSEKMIAGSGLLSLKVVRDGPTRVIRVMDILQKRAGMARETSSWTLISRQSSSHSVDPQRDEKSPATHRRISFNVDMRKGLGFSLISNVPEELLYFTMSGVTLEASFDEKIHKFGLKIRRIQIDNQLFDGRPPVMLHRYDSFTKSSKEGNTSAGSSLSDSFPALSIDAIKLPSTTNLYEIYHSLCINIGEMCLQIEETLLLKLIQFIRSGFAPDTDLSLLDETKMDLVQNTTMSKIIKDSSKRYYFDSFVVAIQPMQLSMYTTSTSRLDSELKAIKQSSNLMLIQFERAPVKMQAYERQHVFETTAFILEEAKKHFTDQLRGQAAVILGSVDFLGNPIGLLSDLKAGVGSFVSGNPGNLVKHITHGFSNSAAKFTGTLSKLSGGITMDQDHEEKRRAIRANPNNATDHFVAGVQSLGTGLVGGLTSIVTQTVRGASDGGPKGFFTGFGKGLVGTFTKPVTGILDFASETASFVRDSSMSSNLYAQKVRLPRTCHSFQGCLECFSHSRAENQQFLHSINGCVYDEWLYSLIEIKRRGKETMPFLVTNKRVYLMRNKEPDPDGISLTVSYKELVTTRAFEQQNEWGLELVVKMESASSHRQGSPLRYSASSGSLHSARIPTVPLRKPRIMCHSEATAKRICDHVNYAKMLASEQSETLPINDDDTENDKAFELEV